MRGQSSNDEGKQQMSTPPRPQDNSPRQPFDLPNTSRRFALGASNVCLVGENADVLRPGVVGMRGSTVIYEYGHA